MNPVEVKKNFSLVSDRDDNDVFADVQPGQNHFFRKLSARWSKHSKRGKKRRPGAVTTISNPHTERGPGALVANGSGWYKVVLIKLISAQISRFLCALQ